MDRPNLKIGKFTNPEGSFITERYLVENKQDLNALLKEFPQLDRNPLGIVTNWKEALQQGRTLLITDESMAGYPTYQFESPKEHNHPGSLIRVEDAS